MTIRTLLAAGAVAAMVAAAPAGLSAQEVDFSGDRIEWIVPFGEGGGTDTMARFLSPIFAKHLPGEPTIIVRNVPGGGSTLGANQFANRAEPDGRTVLQTGGSTVMPYLLGDPRVEYDYRDFEPVMATASGAVVYIQPDLGVSDTSEIQDLKGQTLRFGSQGASSLDLLALWAFRMLDLDVQPVFGMEGSGPKRLAFERGESQIDMQTSAGYIDHVQPREEAGEVVPLWAWGVVNDEGELERDPSFPQIPHFGEAYEALHGEPPSGEDFEVMKALIEAGYGTEKFIFLPGGTPDEIVQAWRDAAAKVVEDPAYLEGRESILGKNPHVVAPRVERALERATSLDDDTRREIVDWLAEEYDYRL
ncbi:Bug family tripartite tricarboxylate transporter substrate binding protein [Acuticoccus sp.]|uniref:Bug family tripartite tricarboxylate transporter substrate binding protein n=1 Tax=Acuticoccus sp. TaxID=1904378 RepID=UPI003B520A5E